MKEMSLLMNLALKVLAKLDLLPCRLQYQTLFANAATYMKMNNQT